MRQGRHLAKLGLGRAIIFGLKTVQAVISFRWVKRVTMPGMIEVFPIGSVVQFGPQKECVILRIQLAPPAESPNILYELGYWSGERGSEHWVELWVNSFMVSSPTAKVSLGFCTRPVI